MNLQEFLLSINGYATLVDSDGTFLGVVSSNQYDLNSICNPHGQYGSPHALYSVRNQHGMYGGSHGIYSPYNPHCIQPPAIVYNGSVVLVVTRNTHLTSFAYGTQLLCGVPIVDPDFLFAVYGCLGTTTATTQFQGGFQPVNPQPYPSTGISSYSQAQVQSNNSEYWFLQGNELSNSQRYEEAIAAYNRAVQIQPNFPDAWNNGGLALANLQRYEEAIAAYNQAIQTQPNYHLAWENRGDVLFKLQRYEEAMASYEQAIQLKSDLAHVWFMHGAVLLDLQRYQESIALVCCDQAIQLKPELIECWSVRGIIFAKLQQYEEAFAAIDKAIQQKPDNPSGWYGKACCYALQGNVELAIKNLKWTIELDSKYREIAKTDTNFDAIREDERFQLLIDG
jgi:Flp pilus assembly protein TadD